MPLRSRFVLWGVVVRLLAGGFLDPGFFFQAGGVKNTPPSNFAQR
jgi:hypothetical protein